MRIAISGLSGCGNTTTSKILAKSLGLELINFTFRNLAEEKGLSFEELHNLAKEDDKYDWELDERQKAMALSNPNCILSSRLAVWLLRDEADFKVYLDFPLEVRAGRIFKREGGTLEQRLAETRERDRQNAERYKRIYGLDMADFSSFCDMVVSNPSLNPTEVAELIIEGISKKSKGKRLI